MRPRYLVAALGYGLCIYLLAGAKGGGALIALLSLAFLLGVPFGIGYLTSRGVGSASWLVSLLAGWVPIAAILGVLFLVGSEGAICIVMALPILLIGSSTGGMYEHGRRRRRPDTSRVELGAVLVLPLLLAPLERRIDPTARASASVTSIDIAAPAEKVWDEIADVDSIRASELGRALFTTIGFPAPIAATLDVPQEGGIRRASFGGGVIFTETVTEWEPERRLAFEIEPSFAEGEPVLDPHVRIGGEYFDVLRGAYDITPMESPAVRGSGAPDAPPHVRLTLTSHHRVTTRFNGYASWWSERVMQSVQRSILAVIKARAEDPARSPKARIREATAARARRESASAREANSFETGFSVIGDLPGRTDVYAESIVVLVRDGRIAWPRLDSGAVHDSTTAALASASGERWTAGRASNAIVLERTATSDTLALGPLLRFTIPRDPGESLDGKWVVFTHHLTVPKTALNPYGLAWAYTHAERPR